MSCPHTEPEVGAYLDGELDLASALAFERHLAKCPECAQALAAQQALRESIAAASLRHHPSPEVTRRFRQATRAPRAESADRRGSWRQLQAIAALLLVAVAGWSLGRIWPPRAAPDLADELTDEVVASHVRSLLAGHPADVISTDQHTVKPWFTGKLDYSPVVVDLKDRGFPLVGGRLDYLDHHPTAALIYRADRHVINLFTWPSAEDRDRAQPNPAAAARQGFHVLHWMRDGMTYWAVSDASEERLRRFAELLRAG
jgi:anti-sigma factor RsiW